MQNLFRIAFWLALVFAVTMAVLPHPPQLPGQPSDKVQHIAAFATLAVLAVLAYPAIPKIRIALALVALGAGIEVVQMIPTLNRDADWRDLVADACAILIMLLAVALAFRVRGKAQ